MKFVLVCKAFGGIPACRDFARNKGRNVGVTMSVVPFLINVLMTVSIFETSNTLRCFVSLVEPKLSTLKMPPSVIPLTVVHPVSNATTLKVADSLVTIRNPSSFVNELTSILRNDASAAFCMLAICFKTMKVGGVKSTLGIKLLTSLTNVVTSVIVMALIFKGVWGEVRGGEHLV